MAKHGFFEDEVKWTLDWDTRPSKEHSPRKSMPCPSCGEIYRGGQCPACGYEPTKKEIEKEGLQFNGSELVEIKKSSNRKTPDPESHWISTLYRCGASKKTFKQAIGIAFGVAEKSGIKGFSIPKEFTVGGKTYQTIPKGSKDQDMLVSSLYPFTTNRIKKTSLQPNG